MVHTTLHARGVTVVEVLVAVSIAGVLIISLAYAMTTFLHTAHQVSKKTYAVYLAEEGLEMVRYLRDSDWNTIDALDTDDVHYLDISTTTIAFTATPEIVGDYSRSITIENAYRDSSTDDIVTSGGVEDVNTKYVTVRVSWDAGSATTSLTGLFANINP